MAWRADRNGEVVRRIWTVLYARRGDGFVLQSFTETILALSLPSGTYLYRLEAAGQTRTGLMTLMK